MPFDPNNPPVKRIKGLSKLPEKKQRQWVHAWNSAYERLKKKSKGEPDEGVIFKIAWGAVKERGRRKKKASITPRVVMLAMTLEKQA